MALIYGLSEQQRLPHAPDAFLDILLKKGAHMAEYAVLYVLLWQALRARSLGLPWVLSMLYAISDEVHQTFVPGRNGWYVDVIIDSTGALLAALALWEARRRKR
jgi:VanZ family protein